MTTYQRRGGQYRTRSGATAYRRGVKGARAKPTVRRTVRRFYRRHTVPCLVVGACGLIVAWHAAPLLVVAAGGMLAVPYVAGGVGRGVRKWRAWQRTPVRRAPSPSTLAARFDSRWQRGYIASRPPVAHPLVEESTSPLAVQETFRTLMNAAGAGTTALPGRPDHPFKAHGRPPLFMCATCNEPHPLKKAAA